MCPFAHTNCPNFFLLLFANWTLTAVESILYGYFCCCLLLCKIYLCWEIGITFALYMCTLHCMQTAHQLFSKCLQFFFLASIYCLISSVAWNNRKYVHCRQPIGMKSSSFPYYIFSSRIPAICTSFFSCCESLCHLFAKIHWKKCRALLMVLSNSAFFFILFRRSTLINMLRA